MRRLRLFCAFLFLSCSFLSAEPVRDTSKTIIIRGDSHYPPYEFINEKGEMDGYNIELTKALMNELGYNYEIKLVSWGEATALLKSKQIDMLMGASFSMDRLTDYNFSLPHSYIRQTLVSPSDKKVRSLEGIVNKQLVVQGNTLAYEMLEDASVASKLIPVDDIGEGLKLLSAGRYDVAICEENIAKYYFEKYNIRNLEYVVLGDIKPVQYCFAVNKDETELLADINDALENLKAKGIYDEIYYKWFGPYEEKTTLPFVWKIVIGAVILLILVLSITITIIRRRVKKATRRIRDINSELELALNAGKVAAWSYDIEQKLFTNLYGETLCGLNGIYLTDFIKLIHQDDIPRLLKILESLSSGSIEMASIRLRYQNSEISGGYSYIESEMSVMKDEYGSVDYLVGTEKDITQDFLYQKALEDSKKKAELSDKLKTAFLSNISHEIRTPLNSIVGFSELLATTEDPVEKEEYKKVIRANNEMLLSLIEDILDLSKIESGDMKLSPSLFDFVYLIYDFDIRYSYKIKNPDIQFVCDNPYSCCMVNLDKEKITKVINSLLSNAEKFTAKGTINLGYKFDGSGIKVWVKDTGIGIEVDKIPLVFDRFQRFNDFAPGTGLGLAISKALVETMGGEIGVESVYGEGSTFWLYVPCKADVTEKPAVEG